MSPSVKNRQVEIVLFIERDRIAQSSERTNSIGVLNAFLDLVQPKAAATALPFVRSQRKLEELLRHIQQAHLQSPHHDPDPASYDVANPQPRRQIHEVAIFTQRTINHTDDLESLQQLTENSEVPCTLFTGDNPNDIPKRSIASGCAWQNIRAFNRIVNNQIPKFDCDILLPPGRPYKLGQNIILKLTCTSSIDVRENKYFLTFQPNQYFQLRDVRVPQLHAGMPCPMEVTLVCRDEVRELRDLRAKMELLPDLLEVTLTRINVDRFIAQPNIIVPLDFTGFKLQVRHFMGDISFADNKLGDKDQKIRCLIVGQQGTGKSSFVNSAYYLYNQQNHQIAEADDISRHVTVRFQRFTPPPNVIEIPFDFHDSVGVTYSNYQGEELPMMISGKMPINVRWRKLNPAGAKKKKNGDPPDMITQRDVDKWRARRIQQRRPVPDQGKKMDCVLVLANFLPFNSAEQNAALDRDPKKLIANVIQKVNSRQKQLVLAISKMDFVAEARRESILQTARGTPIIGQVRNVLPLSNHTNNRTKPWTFHDDKTVANILLELFEAAQATRMIAASAGDVESDSDADIPGPVWKLPRENRSSDSSSDDDDSDGNNDDSSTTTGATSPRRYHGYQSGPSSSGASTPDPRSPQMRPAGYDPQSYSAPSHDASTSSSRSSFQPGLKVRPQSPIASWQQPVPEHAEYQYQHSQTQDGIDQLGQHVPHTHYEQPYQPVPELPQYQTEQIPPYRSPTMSGFGQPPCERPTTSLPSPQIESQQPPVPQHPTFATQAEQAAYENLQSLVEHAPDRFSGMLEPFVRDVHFRNRFKHAWDDCLREQGLDLAAFTEALRF